MKTLISEEVAWTNFINQLLDNMTQEEFLSKYQGKEELLQRAFFDYIDRYNLLLRSSNEV